VYEAVYGASREAVRPDAANPLPLILPAVEMLRDFGETAAADRIVKAMEVVLVDGKVRTADIGGTATTTEFTDAVVVALRA
jgi:isocitrate dehydrogenase (NAD+)